MCEWKCSDSISEEYSVIWHVENNMTQNWTEHEQILFRKMSVNKMPTHIMCSDRSPRCNLTTKS